MMSVVCEPLSVEAATERVLRLAFKGLGVSVRRSLRSTGCRADTADQLERLGDSFFACQRDEWETLCGDARRGGFYWGEGWRHPETGEDVAGFLHRVLWDLSHPAGLLNVWGDGRQVPMYLCAYVKSPGDWVTVERGR